MPFLQQHQPLIGALLLCCLEYEANTHYYCCLPLVSSRFMVYTCLPDGNADKASLKVQLYSRAKTMRQVCADVKASLNLTARVDTRLSLKKLEADTAQGAIGTGPVPCAARGRGSRTRR